MLVTPFLELDNIQVAFLWTAAFVSPLELSYHYFLVLFFPSSWQGVFSCILPVHLGHLTLFMII
jgi:hypothetical protein